METDATAEDRLDSVREMVSKARKMKGMSQQQLAEAAGVERKTIHRFENGLNTFNLATLIRVCDALNIRLMMHMDIQ